MSTYGDVAILAQGLYASGAETRICVAWKRAAQRLFPHSVSMQEKDCPRYAFLGLCEEGLVRDVPPGSYTGSKLNKGYALDCVQLLIDFPELTSEPKRRWQRIAGEKTHNHQADVVVALWNAGLIDP